MRVTAIIQARLGSTRLPRKVLADVNGAPMLKRCVDRVRSARLVDQVLVATTTAPRDDALVAHCEGNRWPVYRGSEEDVLQRYHAAAHHDGADVVLRITSDCPLIDPGIIDKVIECFHRESADYASNTIQPRTFPRGLDAEVFSTVSLDRANREALASLEREHVTPYFYNNPDRFRLRLVRAERDFSYLRWTVDTEEDLTLVRRIYRHFGETSFSWHDVLAAYDVHPEWRSINEHVQQKAL
jgi:spore coat polysaccharide biosynthesis protein SpsF